MELVILGFITLAVLTGHRAVTRRRVNSFKRNRH